MKIERLIGILSILLQQKKVTAPYLAEKFEVSRRTINRDVEAICKAGIPIVTTQGTNGGISIMEGYRINRTLLTSADMQAILAGLRSLDSISETRKMKQLMEKLSASNPDILSSNDHILIDLSSWYRSLLAPRIELIQNAIERREKISSTYFSPSGESRRTADPYLLVFKWSSWYIWARCCEKQDFRLFKLNRMLYVENSGEPYEAVPFSAPDLSPEHVTPPVIQVKALFEGQMRWRLIEEYGPECFKEQKDGRLLFTFGFSDKENLFSWVFSFGDKVELLEPRDLRQEFILRAEKLLHTYHLSNYDDDI